MNLRTSKTYEFVQFEKPQIYIDILEEKVDAVTREKADFQFWEESIKKALWNLRTLRILMQGTQSMLSEINFSLQLSVDQLRKWIGQSKDWFRRNKSSINEWIKNLIVLWFFRTMKTLFEKSWDMIFQSKASVKIENHLLRMKLVWRSQIISYED